MDFQFYINLIVGFIIGYAPKIVGAIIVWIIGSWIIGRLAKVLVLYMEKTAVDVSLRGFIKSLVSIGLRIMLLFSIAGILGIETTSFVAVLGAASLAVGLALQGSLSNFAGGVLILLFKPFQVGDKITAMAQTGVVKEIQIFTTVIITVDGRTVILPNGPLSNGTIVNFSREGLLVFEVFIEIDGKYDFEKAKEAGLKALSQESRVVGGQKVELAKFAAGRVISVSGKVNPKDFDAVVASVNEKVHKVFAESGLGAPESHQFVHTL